MDFLEQFLSFYNNKANISESEQEDPEVIIDTISDRAKLADPPAQVW